MSSPSPHSLSYLGLKRASATSTHMRWVATFKCQESGETLEAIIRIPMHRLTFPLPIVQLTEQVSEINRILSAWCKVGHTGGDEGLRGLTSMLDRELVVLSGRR